ncbi:MAG: hypoxanthine phosphoribosyltransferase [Deltaproteobacteria bacterium]|nr:hypoxanthine phosphoribosyltransferase [Deltaproteobacteria bacterium]
MNGDDRFKILVTEDAIQERVRELGVEITRDYRGRDLVLVGVLKGSCLFMADLCRHVDLPLTMEFLGLSSYGDRTESSGVVQITQDLTHPVEDMDVLLVEDIVDTGLTLDFLMDHFRVRKPRSVGICTLLHKPSNTVKDVQLDYVGFTIENRFVVGYGLDYEQRFRNLPYIGYVED